MIAKRDLLQALDVGIDPLEKKPFEKIALSINASEEELLEAIQNLKQEKEIKRFGLVVLNRSVGLAHNAMVTFDIPNELVDETGCKVSKYPFIKLCYQRVRLPEWDYNLYFMIHGPDKETVLKQLEQIVNDLSLDNYKHQILFSNTCFKQKGASYH